MTVTHGRVLLTGGSGLLAVNWARRVRDRAPVTLGLHRRAISLARVATRRIDLESADAVARTIDEVAPELVVHTAGMTSVDACETQPDAAQYVNVELAENVAKACATAGVKLAHISTDHLFGAGTSSNSEDDHVSPTNVYGRTKAEAERRVLAVAPDALVIRTNFYGWGTSYRRSFSDNIIDGLRSGREIPLFDDVLYTPILTDALADAVHTLADRGATGVFNVTGDDTLSKHAFGVMLAERFGLDRRLIVPRALQDHPSAVHRPHYMNLSNRKATAAIGRAIGGVNTQLEALALQEHDGVKDELRAL